MTDDAFERSGSRSPLTQADEAVLDALDRLTSREAAAFRGQLNGLSPAEVAEDLGLEATSIKTYGRRARAKLAAALGHAPTPGDLGFYGVLWIRRISDGTSS